MTTIYPTGYTTDGKLLLGGVWTHYHQNGFPVEMSYMSAQARGARIDWLEAMADASTTDNLPALVEEMTTFMPKETVDEIGARFADMISKGHTYDSILESKKSKAIK